MFKPLFEPLNAGILLLLFLTIGISFTLQISAPLAVMANLFGLFMLAPQVWEVYSVKNPNLSNLNNSTFKCLLLIHVLYFCYGLMKNDPFVYAVPFVCIFLDLLLLYKLMSRSSFIKLFILLVISLPVLTMLSISLLQVNSGWMVHVHSLIYSSSVLITILAFRGQTQKLKHTLKEATLNGESATEGVAMTTFLLEASLLCLWPLWAISQIVFLNKEGFLLETFVNVPSIFINLQIIYMILQDKHRMQFIAQDAS